jgi:transcriptional regulator with XRE-family HTH domain
VVTVRPNSRFGALLRRYRIAAGMTQEALAEQARLSRRGLQDLARAARLFETAEVLREALGAPLDAPYRAIRDRALASVRAALGEEAFTAASAEGRAMTPEEAIALALGEEADRTLRE